MAGVAPAAYIHSINPAKGIARQDGDAVVALLPGVGDVRVAERAQVRERHALVRALGLLKAEHVRPRGGEVPADLVDAKPDRVDVPSRDREAHGASEAFFSNPDRGGDFQRGLAS